MMINDEEERVKYEPDRYVYAPRNCPQEWWVSISKESRTQHHPPPNDDKGVAVRRRRKHKGQKLEKNQKMIGLKDSILSTVSKATNEKTVPFGEPSNMSLENIIQQDSQEYIYEDDEEECESISEEDLLKLMEQEQDSLQVCRGLLKWTPESLRWETIPSLHFLTPSQISSLFESGLVIIDNAIPSQLVKDSYKKAIEWSTQGKLIAASDHRLDDDPFRARNARSDKICWLHQNDTESHFKPLLDIFESIHKDLSHLMHLHGEFEFQLAHYTANGIGYETHRDSFPCGDPSDTEQRRITAICYLNLDWDPEHKGSLRIHRKGLEQDVDPVGGRIVLFFSGVIDHQVLTATVDRVALTCWMK